MDDMRSDTAFGQQLVRTGKIVAPALLDLDVATVDAGAPPGVVVGAHLRLDGPARRATQLDVVVRLGGLLNRDTAALVPRLPLQIDLVAELPQLAQQGVADPHAILTL